MLRQGGVELMGTYLVDGNDSDSVGAPWPRAAIRP
jgi:hypothetical protein